MHLCESTVVQRVEIDDLRIRESSQSIAKVALAAELEPVEDRLGDGEHVIPIGVQRRVHVPAGGLLLRSGGSRPAHDRLVGERRVAALAADVVRVERVPWAAIQ